MPMYEYKCRTCDNEFELNLNIDDRDELDVIGPCTGCRSLRVERIIVFKGSVWAPTAGGYR